MNFYSAQTSQAIDHDAIDNHGIPGILLMKRAAWFAWQTMQDKLLSNAPNQIHSHQHIHIVCGPGNNGGDGFVLAQYAAINGYKTTVSLLGERHHIKGDALIALQEMEQAGLELQSFNPKLIENADFIVDAIFGTGLSKAIQGEFAEAIEAINQANKKVMALDIPSGINANTGAVLGTAIRATHTCTFITRKLGHHMAEGESFSGQVSFSRLFLAKEIYQAHPALAENQPLKYWLNKLPERTSDFHKGKAGTNCLIGGDLTMMGAIQLAGMASLKCGSGLGKVISHAEHAIAITQAVPELMCYPETQLSTQLVNAKAYAIGPGLGQNSWGEALFNDTLHRVAELNIAGVIDADALRLLQQWLNSSSSTHKHNWVLTPHPGEAAQLLGITNTEVQADRIKAIKQLHEKFGGVIVLKGNGTLIYNGNRIQICLAGNPGMAVGGMGDVLTGAISAFLAQGLSLWDAANLGVSLHAHAADIHAQQHGQNSLLPSDVTNTMGQLLAYRGSASNA